MLRTGRFGADGILINLFESKAQKQLSKGQFQMALSGRQTAGAALAGAPEAGAAARIARCSHSHETLHRSRVTVPPRDRPGIIIHHLHVTDSYPPLHATNGPRLGGVRATSSRARSITSLRWHDASLFPPLAVQTGCQTSSPTRPMDMTIRPEAAHLVGPSC